MSVQSGHFGSGVLSEPVATGDINDLANWCSCTTESVRCAAGEIIVLRVDGEVDLGTLPILQTAMGGSLDRHPAHLVVDLARMTFCSVRGLTLLVEAGRTAAAIATGYVVSGVPPEIDRVWTLLWDRRDLPVRRHSTAAAVTAIRAAG